MRNVENEYEHSSHQSAMASHVPHMPIKQDYFNDYADSDGNIPSYNNLPKAYESRLQAARDSISSQSNNYGGSSPQAIAMSKLGGAPLSIFDQTHPAQGPREYSPINKKNAALLVNKVKSHMMATEPSITNTKDEEYTRVQFMCQRLQ